MYCPQCGTESTTGQQYCRSCGANLRLIGKAVTLSEAVARSDRGPLPKLKEAMKNLKVEHVTEEVSRAFDQINKEIVKNAAAAKAKQAWWQRREKTPEQRRERQIVSGTVSLFSGVGLTIFLYYLTTALQLKLPPDVIARVPVEIDPILHVLWLVGLIPTFSGLGRIIAGLTIRPSRKVPELTAAHTEKLTEARESVSFPQRVNFSTAASPAVSVTEHTTNILHRAAPGRGTNEISEDAAVHTPDH